MRSNFHLINTTLKYVHTFKEYVYGATEFIQNLFKNNIIRIKNEIATKLYVKLKFQNDNDVKIKNNELISIIKSALKLNNDMRIQNDNNTKLHIYVNPKENCIKIYNSLMLYISKKINIGNIIKIYNTASARLKMKLNLENDAIVNNDDITTYIEINCIPNENNVFIDNEDVYSAAWYFTRLETMSGSLNSYYNKSIEDTSRTKVV